MFLIRLSLLMCVNLFLYAKCSIPVVKLCVDPACKETISLARGSVEYSSPDKRILSFRKGQHMLITSYGRDKNDYWGAVINKKFGYVPSSMLKEEKILHEKSKLIPVPVVATQESASSEEVPQHDVSKKQKGEVDHFTQPELSDLNKSSAEIVDSIKKPITPAETYKVIEGTTIYADEVDEIIPSPTVQVKSSQTAVPPTMNRGTTQKQERATIPPELINFNSNLKEEKSNLIVENVSAEDDSATIEDDGEDDDEEEEDENEDEDGPDDADIEINGDELSDTEKNTGAVAGEKHVNKAPNMEMQNMAKSSSESVVAGVDQNLPNPAPFIENNLINQLKIGVSDNKVDPLEQNPNKNPDQPPHWPGGLNGIKNRKNNANGPAAPEGASRGMSGMGGEVHTALPQAEVGMLPEAAVRPSTETATTAQIVKQTVGTNGEVTLQLGAGTGTETTVKPTIGTARETSVQPGFQAGPEAASVGTGPGGTVQTNAETGTTPQPVKQTATLQLGAGAGPEATVKPNLGTVREASVQPGFQAGPEAASVGTGPGGTVQTNAETGTTPQPVKQTATLQLGAGAGPETTVKPNLGTVREASVQPGFQAGPEAASVGTGPGGTMQPNAETGTTPQPVKQTATLQLGAGAGPEAAVKPNLGTVREASVQPGFQAGPEAASAGRGAEETMQPTAETGYGPAPQLVKQKVHESSATTPPSAAASQIPHAVPPQVVPDLTVKTVVATPSVVEEDATIFSQFSVSAEETHNSYKPAVVPDIIQDKVEVTTEAPVAVEPENQIPSRSSSPADIQQNVEETREALITPSPLPEAMTDEPFLKEGEEIENASEDFGKPDEKDTEQPGMLDQITGILSGWFTSAPREELPDDRANYETAFRDFTTDAETGSSEAPSGTCQNPELGVDCEDFPPGEEQATWWSHWVPGGLAFDGILKQGNTLVYLVVTAVTVLLFTLGHNFIEKRGKTGPLIAKINKLEHELLVMSKECIMFKDEVQSAREKIALYENSANDELVVSLQADLQEAKKIRSELESSIDALQQELDTATEAGLDLNKMLSEVLTQKGGSETLLKSVESLQGQLDSQQQVIDEMTKKLGVKNQENEALQSALEAANDKTENLEEELTEIKHSLSIHLKDKEDLTLDLNSQIDQLKACATELRVTKDEEISKVKKEMEELQGKFSKTSTALTVKEEEVKALKESMRHLKAKGDVKMETVFDFSRVKAELAKETKENATLLEKLATEEKSKKALAEQVTVLDGEVHKLKKNYEEAEQKKNEAEKKLEVLSTYFKEKETQLQKELGLQEALWAQKKGDENAVCNMMKSLQEEVESYKSQNETLKKEILDQERGLKNQIAGLEQKAHENWVAARQAERNLEEAKQEMAQLRNRLVSLAERKSENPEGRGNLRSTEEINGVEAASPILHDTSSPLLFPPLPLDPNGSNLLPPGFMPPPPFMPPVMGGFMPPPPFLPGDRRPPPLGRMSSPPLNNRFSPSSPGDYPFERMSSPPLSPPGSNYRSPNEDRDHYRHRMPPYPVPLHPRNWDDGNEMPGFIPISSQRDSRRDHKGSNVSSEHSSSESLDKSSRHSGRV